MRWLAVRGGNDTLSTKDREKIKVKLYQLAADVENIYQETEFNGKTLLDATWNNLTIQAGTNNETRTVNLKQISDTLSKLKY